MWIELTVEVQGRLREMLENRNRRRGWNAEIPDNGKVWVNLDQAKAIILRDNHAIVTGALGLPVVTRVPQEIETLREYLGASALK